jgi:demethylmenaquinone methyltransferase/2-methoxy-6-polyprenyl-1,4-benzoquinol methylase
MGDSTTDKDRVDFGYQRVEAKEKQSLIDEVFAKVADRYDQMNDLMSMGLHRLWKDDLVTMLRPPSGDRCFEVLDVAGGTGDVAVKIAAQAGSAVRVTIADASPQMVAQGKRRVAAEGLQDRVKFLVGNAERLPFADRQFDAYTIAFGLRNVTDTHQALKEAYRVLKLGGRFLCLEFSQVSVPMLKQFYDLYSFTVIPAMGKIVTGDGRPYRYLVESIRTFPDQPRLALLLEKAGFSRVRFRNLAGGIVAIHSAWRL